jgi:hypothetical protein
MDEWNKLEQAIGEMTAAGDVEVHEDGEWLAELAGLHCEVQRQGKEMLVHLWSESRNLVRRVTGVSRLDPGRIVMEVQRCGRSKPGRLEFVARQGLRPEARISRQQFRARFGRMLAEQFPDAQIDSLTAAANLEHSFSGLYTRGMMKEGAADWAITGVSTGEDATAVDGILTSGLLWLDWNRQRAAKRPVAGLRLFVPEGSAKILLHRLRGISKAGRTELYEYNEQTRHVGKVDTSDTGNLESWLIPRREAEQALAAAGEAIQKVRSVAGAGAENIAADVAPGTNEVVFRYLGLEFARWQNGLLFSGPDGTSRPVTSTGWNEVKRAIETMKEFRTSHPADPNHSYYRSAPERWLETIVVQDPTRLDAHLDPLHVYSQVPAFSAADRGVLDLLGATRDGRLVVIELKASEDLHLPMQAVDYWLRVRRHHKDGDFQKCGYFSGITLDERAPLLWLVSPGLRFHPSTDVILKYLSPEIQVTRIGLNETWRQQLQVVFRM